MQSTAPSYLVSGSCRYTKFPELWPKLSIQNKTRRLLREVKASCGVAFQADRKSFLHQYIPLVFQLVIKHLETGCKDEILKACEILVCQGMSAEMFKEHVITLLMDHSADRFAEVDTKTKTAFTKGYN